MLAKALAHFFEAKLLLLDVTDFSMKVSIYGCSLCLNLTFVQIVLMVGFIQIQSKYGSANKESVRFL
jgi:hypothetical protein